MMVRDKFVKLFQIDDRSVAPVFLGDQEGAGKEAIPANSSFHLWDSPFQ